MGGVAAFAFVLFRRDGRFRSVSVPSAVAAGVLAADMTGAFGSAGTVGGEAGASGPVEATFGTGGARTFERGAGSGLGEVTLAGAVGGEAGALGGAACSGAGTAGFGGPDERGRIGTNSPGFQVWGCRRTVGSFTNRSAWPHPRHTRVPRASSPPLRSERPPRPIPPVLRFSAQTKSFPPQLLQTGTGHPR
jgi:hypothetical protein